MQEYGPGTGVGSREITAGREGRTEPHEHSTKDGRGRTAALKGGRDSKVPGLVIKGSVATFLKVSVEPWLEARLPQDWDQ